MEHLPAGAASTVEDCLRRVRSCDVFVGIVADRYGWIPEGYEISICELEYDVAKKNDLPRLIFEIEAADGATGASDHPQELEAFRAKLRGDQRPARCRDADLGMVVLHSLMSLQSEGAAPRASLDGFFREIAADLHRLRCTACEELDRSAAILTNLPLDLSPIDAQRREEASLRLREIGVKLLNVPDVPEQARLHLIGLGLPDVGSMRKAGGNMIFLSNNTTLCFHPTTADQHATERENRTARDEARRLLRCPGS